ncbi:hypothetical protein HDU91_006546 [Kappamyces sp. JEL0680]|nr:hypothetical protein HDU91_006546 [Kappamyces sp. JEL0680]
MSGLGGRFRRFARLALPKRSNLLSHSLVAVAGVAGIMAIGFGTRHEAIWSTYEANAAPQKSPGKSSRDSFAFKSAPVGIQDHLGNIKRNFELTWGRMESVRKAAWGVIGVNTVIFIAWQVPRLSRFMSTHFLHVPAANRPYTLFTCMFSHQNFMHFGFNMLAVSSFLPFFERSSHVSTEQSLAVYLSAGILSSLASHYYSALIPGRAFIGSLGASGAIWALVAGGALANPHQTVSLVFLPFYEFKLETLVPLLLALDLVGLVRGWRLFDHAAHLGGALVGYAYCTYGVPLWYQLQERLFYQRLQARSRNDS